MVETSKYPVQVRANARLVDAGRKDVLDCPSEYHVQICVVLIVDYDWKIKDIPEQYKEEVESIIGTPKKRTRKTKKQ